MINRLVVLGFVLVLTGAVLPFLIIVGVLPSTFLLNFIAFATSVCGIFLGVLGTATFVGEERRKGDWRNRN
ncbi:MAG: hypothetical protein IPM39_23980 [Chloroflexi bacterium]|nr:hypothetical protein [Chloroflexota bacterium]